MKPIRQDTLERFMTLAGERLDGDWVIIGGSVLPLLGIEHRVTLDIDLASCNPETSQRSLVALMELAQEIGLPVEGINQAAAYFLEKIPNWRQDLVRVHTGSRANFFRPNLALFLRLKITRLSESDLEDCLQFLRKRSDECEDRSCRALIAEINSLSHSCQETDKKQRYRNLEKALRKGARLGKTI
jgi:hypothetical protein